MEVLKPLRRIKHLFVFHSRRLLPLCVAVHQQHARRILRHHHHEHRLLEDRSRTVEVDDVEAPELVQHPDLLRELRHCILACVNLLQSLDRHAVTAERPFVTISKVPSEICRSMWTSVGGSFVVMTVRSLSASWSVAWVWRSMPHCQRQELVDDTRARRRDEHLERTRLLRLQDDLLGLRVEDEFIVLVLRAEAELQAVLPDVPDVDFADERLVDFALDKRRDRRAVDDDVFRFVGWNEIGERLIL